MQIILTEEEYNKLKSNSVASESITDYQRKFRSHLSRSIQSAGGLRCGGVVPLEALRNMIDQAEEFAQKAS